MTRGQFRYQLYREQYREFMTFKEFLKRKYYTSYSYNTYRLSRDTGE